MEEKIKQYLAQFNFDIRKSGNARFMDQKVTPDVLSFIADCVENFVCENYEKEFTVKDIWNSNYFEKNARFIFNKPSAKNETTKGEYNKFIGQPLKMLSYAGILTEETKGITNHYSVNNPELLSYISLKDRNAFNFLFFYLEKVLSDSNFLPYIHKFINLCKTEELENDNYIELRSYFEKFMRGNTSIGSKGSDGLKEIRRILPKIINVFAVQNSTFGVKKGRLSKYEIYYSDLMYNVINFRDLNKDKQLSRQDSIKKSHKLLKLEETQLQEYNGYLVQKAMNKIKKKYKFSEVKDGDKSIAIHVHHIFPKNEFPQLAHYLENLIKLTANQHLNKSHPNGNTQIISKEYQQICLISKSKSIQESLISNELLYSKPNFIYVINTGLKPSKQFKNTYSFSEIENHLKTEYKKILS